MKWLDTNIILRYLTGDDPVKARACLTLFQRVRQGDEELTTSDVIVAEVTYVLTSQYQLDHAEIAARLLPLLVLPGLKLHRKRVVLRALEIYAQYRRLDFEDALSAAQMEHLGVREILSYDTDFDRVPGLIRQEP
ncbi:MAG TPA: PIN domain-containing protein [Thermomicrobiaceae bacterium]|nr:PIN domain-containing protein [Thermomicrobiaceae bacterium]